jgi:hypothetical protein
VTHLVRCADPVGGDLGGLVGVEGTLVVGPGALVQLPAAEVGVEALELGAERGDVLLGQLLDRLQPGALLLDRSRLPATARDHGHGDRRHDEHQREEQPCHTPRLRSGP